MHAGLRRWGAALIAGGAVWVALAGCAAAQYESTTASFFTPRGYQRFLAGVHHPVCSMYGAVIQGLPGPVFGQGSGGAAADGTAQYVADSALAHLTLPPGGTLVGGTLSGAVVESDAGAVPAGQASFAVGSEEGVDYGFGLCPALYDAVSVAVDLPGNTVQRIPFTVSAFAMLAQGIVGGAPGNDGNLALTGGPWLAPAGAFTLTAEYAYTPAGIAWNQVSTCGAHGCGTQYAISWNPNGNTADIRYVLQRETLQGDGVAQGWTTMYQGPGTSFTTTNQVCGLGYLYRVAAYGQRGPAVTTPWDASGQLDEYPCAAAAASATPTAVTVSWRPVTTAAVPDIVWCEEDTPGGGVGCEQTSIQVAAGSASATIAGLTPNAEYAVWVCAATDAWGCPEVNVWTYAATPSLAPVNDGAGVPSNAQPLAWGPSGNAPGTVYVLQRQTVATDGPAPGAATLYQGTGVRFVAPQAPGGSYVYRVAALNAGYGGQTPPSAAVPVQVAAVPELSVRGPTTATVSWAPVPSVRTTGVVCEVARSNDWIGEGQATGGATAFALSALSPDTPYVCAIFAAASNAGIEWWQGTPSAWTDAVAPSDLRAETDGAGVAAPDQPLLWGSGGNPTGTTFLLLQNGTAVYRGAATAFTATQAAGGSYDYVVYALNGAGVVSPGSDPVVTQVAPVPALAAAGQGALALSWPAVAGMGTTGITCAPPGSGAAVASGQATGGARRFVVTGLAPNTPYRCAIAATSTNQGIPWPEAGAAVATLPAAPALTAATNAGGVTPPDQPLAWTATGTAPLTFTLTQNGRVVYRGPDSAFTALQGPGGVYVYRVTADNASGAGPSSGTLTTDVAAVPAFAASGATTATVSWHAYGAVVPTEVACAPAGDGEAAPAQAAVALNDLTPNTMFTCTARAETSAGIAWPELAAPGWTAAALPAAARIARATQTSVTVAWGGDGNPADTLYRAQVFACGRAAPVAASPWRTGASWTLTGLTAGTCYQGAVVARNGAGSVTPVARTPEAPTVPLSPGTLAGTDDGLGWSPTAGRGYVTLSWAPVPGATAYEVWVYDGSRYEGFPVGPATTWDSRAARIYPPAAALFPNVGEASATAPVFSHNAGGLDLRDRPLDLYCTTGTAYCTAQPAQNYWFTVSAANASGNSATYQVPGRSAPAADYQEPTLPLQTDPSAPTITALHAGNADGYAYGPNVQVSLRAAESPSGIAAYALSDDGTAWTTTAVPGCTVGQVAACAATLRASVPWTLPPGPGTRTVYARVESTAGVWSAVADATVYVEPDQTPPTVALTLDGGEVRTGRTALTAATVLTDPLARQAGLTFQARYSVDGGATWTAWSDEQSATSWTATVTVPGGASGERTVLEQVEDSDLNVGEGTATVYYVNPTPVSVGGGNGAGGPSGVPRPCTWSVDGTSVPATCVTVSQVSVPLSPPPGSLQMRVSLDDVTWGPWLPVAPRLPLDLGASPGAKTVWVQFRDARGRVTAEPPAYYVFDPGPPRLRVAWAGDASATDPLGAAVLQVQASDDVGQPASLHLTVSEGGVRLYAGPAADAVPLTLAGTGYQLVQVTVTDIAGNQTSALVGIFVE